MRGALTAIALLFIPLAQAQTEYLGLYLKGAKIGYAQYSKSPAALNGRAVTRSDSKTVMDAGLEGQALSLAITTSVWSDKKGRPIRMLFRTTSSGRTQIVDAFFAGGRATVRIDNSGQKSSTVLQIPAGPIVDDPLTLFLAGGLKGGSTKSYYVLDPMTVSFIRNDIKVVGNTRTEVHGALIAATKIEVIDPRASMNIYVKGLNQLIKVDAPMGIEMAPVTKEVALRKDPSAGRSIDLAGTTSIEPDKPISNPSSLAELRIRVMSPDLLAAPSDDHQTVVHDADGWTFDIHPVSDSEPSGDKTASDGKPMREWTKPSLDIPCGDPTIVNLAHRIAGQHSSVSDSARAIQMWVYRNMNENAGIGVLRDAKEILKTHEGVCRDYAVLTTALLRADGIPARLVSGLVDWDDKFYYHAWSEAWNGKHWIGIDSTTDDPQLSAAHVKLADGNVGEAFTFTFLGQARIQVISAKQQE